MTVFAKVGITLVGSLATTGVIGGSILLSKNSNSQLEVDRSDTSYQPIINVNSENTLFEWLILKENKKSCSVLVKNGEEYSYIGNKCGDWIKGINIDEKETDILLGRKEEIYGRLKDWKWDKESGKKVKENEEIWESEERVCQEEMMSDEILSKIKVTCTKKVNNKTNL